MKLQRNLKRVGLLILTVCKLGFTFTLVVNYWGLKIISLTWNYELTMSWPTVSNYAC